MCACCGGQCSKFMHVKKVWPVTGKCSFNHFKQIRWLRSFCFYRKTHTGSTHKSIMPLYRFARIYLKFSWRGICDCVFITFSTKLLMNRMIINTNLHKSPCTMNTGCSFTLTKFRRQIHCLGDYVCIYNDLCTYV